MISYVDSYVLHMTEAKGFRDYSMGCLLSDFPKWFSSELQEAWKRGWRAAHEIMSETE